MNNESNETNDGLMIEQKHSHRQLSTTFASGTQMATVASDISIAVPFTPTPTL